MLLICGTNYSKANSEFFYGGATDSVLVSFDDIRTANAKMIELNYEKEINDKLRKVIITDSIIISKLEFNLDNTKKQLKKSIRRERIAEGCCGLSLIGLILALLM